MELFVMPSKLQLQKEGVFYTFLKICLQEEKIIIFHVINIAVQKYSWIQYSSHQGKQQSTQKYMEDKVIESSM